MNSSKMAFGVVLIILAIIGGGLKYLLYWGSAELVGRNIFTLLLVGGGIYLINKGRKAKKPATQE